MEKNNSLPDLTEKQLEIGEVGVLKNLRYLAVSDNELPCNGCDVGCLYCDNMRERDPNVKCNGIIFKHVPYVPTDVKQPATTQLARLALIYAEISIMEGMKAENAMREAQGNAPSYDETIFFKCAERFRKLANIQEPT